MAHKQSENHSLLLNEEGAGVKGVEGKLKFTSPLGVSVVKMERNDE